MQIFDPRQPDALNRNKVPLHNSGAALKKAAPTDIYHSGRLTGNRLYKIACTAAVLASAQKPQNPKGLRPFSKMPCCQGLQGSAL